VSKSDFPDVYLSISQAVYHQPTTSMPGPGQGKQSQKKKWHDNAKNAATTCAITKTMASTTTDTPASTAETATSAT
jgi:hypothetical protein